MGFFGKKKTIIVSSTVYNMAGEEENRPNFIQNTVYGAIMSPHNPYIGQQIVTNLFRGPGINQRSFFRWAVRNEYPGLPTYSVSLGKTIDPAVVAPFIPTPGSPSGLELAIQTSQIVSGDYDHIVEEYVLDNYPENYNTDYVSSYDKTLNEVTIQWFGGGSVTFSAGTYSPDKTYIVANFYHYLPAEVGSLDEGTPTVGDLSKPSTTGYGLDSSNNTGIVNYGMTYDERITVIYTGSEPPTLPTDTDNTTAESDNPGFNGLDEEWSKVTYEGGSGDDQETVTREHFLSISEYRQIYTDNTVVSIVVNEDTPVAGQTETITTYRIGDHIRPIYDWQIDTQDTVIRSVVGDVGIYIYEVGTGEATLDALYEEITVGGEETEYFPYIPIRLDNVSITDPIYDDITGSGLYEFSNRAYRRAASRVHGFSKLIDEIEENEDIDDIDYAFTHHGVSLNVIEPECRKYMYKWFKNVSAYQNTSASYMTDYGTLVTTYAAEVADMNDWIYDQGDPARGRYGDPPPVQPELVSLETTTIRLACEDPQLENLDMRVTWVNIDETLHSGAPTNPDTGQPAITDDVWIEDGTDLEWTVTTGIYPNAYDKDYSVEQMIMYWQTGSNSYKKLTMWGLLHQNYVYGGESVDITGKEGLAEEDPTGFIIPLHMPTVRNLGLVSATQMATANTYIIFNTYEIVKQKWYQTIVGMIIIFIVIVAITVITGGLGAGAGAGILGTNAAVGAAVGLTGTAAILAGAIINALVAIAISQIVSYASVAIFGEKWGAIVAAVINLMISFGASGGFSAQGLADIGSASNILKIAAAVANGYEGYTQGAVAEIGDDMIENKEEFDEEMEKINKLMKELMGGNSLNFDQLTLTDTIMGNVRSASGGGYLTETLDEFIHRTTMTGSDVADITLSMVNNFADLSLELPR